MIVLVAANVFVAVKSISLFFAVNEFESRLILMELALLKSGILIYAKNLNSSFKLIFHCIP